MALMKLRDIFEKNDYKIVNYLPGRKSKGEGWRILPVTRHVTRFHQRDVYWSMSASAYIPDERARAQVYPFSYTPSLRKDKAASSVPVTADFGRSSWKKGVERRKNLRTSTQCAEGSCEVKLLLCKVDAPRYLCALCLPRMVRPEEPPFFF